MLHIDTARTIVDQSKADGAELTVTLADGTTVTGTPVSVNSKGVNIKVDGKVRSFGLGRVAALTRVGDTDGLTTAAVAGMLGITPKELRVHLRALHMNVGKGQTYALTMADVAAVRDYLATRADA